MTTLFSYVVADDTGWGPHPTGRYCTLVWCKYKETRRSHRSIIELAKEGDWIVGTGGVKNAGPGKLIYAMRVDEKILLAEYCKDKRFASRYDAVPDPEGRMDRWALISRHFFYFGGAAVQIPARFRNHPLEKSGRSFRHDFDHDFITRFVAWLESKYTVGMSGEPCKPSADFPRSNCRPKVLRKVCVR